MYYTLSYAMLYIDEVAGLPHGSQRHINGVVSNNKKYTIIVVLI